MATSTLEPSTAPADLNSPPIPPASSDPGRRLRIAGVAALLIGTAALYLWGLSASGHANSFYSAAVQAGSQSWKAFLFGSLDAGNAITVDKPPASLWLMALSVRIFGLSSWSILVPQSLLGVATVGVLYASVRRTSGHAAGLVAGAILALTPAAASMFRFNNPDALLVFLLTAASYLALRAAEKASGRLLVGAGVLIGFAFLTKMLQAFLVLPAFALVYLVAAPTTVRKRLLHLVAAFGATIVSLGWWVAIVELVPASWRPYVGGSENNSVLDLIFGYNGLGRIFGQGGGQGGMWGEAGATRLFDGVSGGMIAWLIPAALLLGTVALVIIGRAHRSHPVRAAIMLWGGWLIVTGLVFSFMAGVYHDYYTVALAPAIAGLVVVAGEVLWRRRISRLARAGLSGTMIITAVWAFVVLGRASEPYSTLRWPVLIIGVLAAVGLLLAHRLPKALAGVVLGLALLGAGTGPAAYAVQTAATPHQGSIVTAGPVSGNSGPGGQGAPGRARIGAGAAGGGTFRGGQPQQGSQAPQDGAQGGQPGGDRAGVSTDLVALLVGDASSYRWAAATTGSQGAAGYQLATGRPVMAIGGFNGGDPSPTLEQFQAYVANGEIHFYISGGNGGGRGGGSGSASQIATWVSQNFTAVTVGNAEVYDLTADR